MGVSHAQRIKDVLDRTKGKIVMGGAMEDSTAWPRRIEPTVVRDVGVDDALMEEYVLLFSLSLASDSNSPLLLLLQRNLWAHPAHHQHRLDRLCDYICSFQVRTTYWGYHPLLPWREDRDEIILPARLMRGRLTIVKAINTFTTYKDKSTVW